MHLLHQRIADQKQVAMPAMCIADILQRHGNPARVPNRVSASCRASIPTQIAPPVGADALVDIITDRSYDMGMPKVAPGAAAARW